ncbi:N4-gp56 family major capsid protein [Bartonella machadoae]|uniref:N4-gp56 family major capsid protein n=1 Tax=Bartonella machadoae TaxID=2893471 RepID=UPI001F4CF4AF|nr:N4-gp56 family major capsid protein [Bartonella machadoae]UNE54960.1 N4-gp56 family major capsid protein [Bartonella machadoae]UNE55350.1 N4-gp56 family major capsid protein [Bartonella machadoae]
MATTNIGINEPHALKTWARMLDAEVSKATPIAPLMGKGSNSIIQVKTETQKGKGDCITFSLRAQLAGRGVSEGETLEGNEEALQFLHDKLYINELYHGTRIPNEGTIDTQRTLFNLREEAKNSLSDWYADRLSLMFFIHACGYTANRLHFEGDLIDLDPLYYGFNTPIAPSSKRIVRPDSKTKDEDLTEKAKHSFNLKLIDEAVQCAKLANPKIRPVRVNGESVYVLYLHPIQVTQLRTNTETGQWLDIQKAAYTGSRAKNPIFDGSLGMYNGVILRESEHVTNGVKSTDSTRVAGVRRAVLLGAQSVVMAFGKGYGDTRYKIEEETFDYKREYGFGVHTIIGMKKTCFQMPGRAQGAQDFGTIVIPTYTGEVDAN